jgi:hypothetical protein
VHERTTVLSEKDAAARPTYIERNENAVPSGRGKFVAIQSLISNLF